MVMTMVQVHGPFAVNGRWVWLSDIQRDLLLKMRPNGVAAREENGRLILECVDGSSRPCGFNPEEVRAQLVALESHGLLVGDVHPHWSLTDDGRKLRAELIKF